MCEGHNTVLQNFLRYQPGNIRSMNLVVQSVEYLKALTAEITEDTLDQTIQVMGLFCICLARFAFLLFFFSPSFTHSLTRSLVYFLALTLRQALESVIEYCQGCQANQQEVFNAQAIDQINHILRMPKMKSCEEKVCSSLFMLFFF